MEPENPRDDDAESLALLQHSPDAYRWGYGLPWGFWATLGFGLLIILAWVIVQSVALICIVFGQLFMSNLPMESWAEELEGIEYNGFALGLSSLIAMPVAVFLCVGFAWLRRNGTTVTDYLALKKMSHKSWLVWSLITVLFIFLVDFVLKAAGAPEENEWMKGLAEKGTSFGWLAVATVICAPLVEEFIFRGFLFKGWMESSLGLVGTVILTNLIWTAIHIQYDIYGLTAVFTLGILLSVARIKTGSLWAPIVIHFVNNALATWGLWEMSKGNFGG